MSLTISPAVRRQPALRAFTLVELLTVMAIILLITGLMVPAVKTLNGAGLVNKAVADLARTLEYARTYAMANRTCVRVLMGQLPAGNGRSVPATTALTIYSADGTYLTDTTTTLAQADQAAMQNSATWPALGTLVVLDNELPFNTLQGSLPDTSADVTPAANTAMLPVKRALSGRGTMTFTQAIQFTATGEARVVFDTPAHYIKVAMDQPLPGNAAIEIKKDPFILRLSGINGSIDILRAENIVH